MEKMSLTEVPRAVSFVSRRLWYPEEGASYAHRDRRRSYRPGRRMLRRGTALVNGSSPMPVRRDGWCSPTPVYKGNHLRNRRSSKS